MSDNKNILAIYALNKHSPAIVFDRPGQLGKILVGMNKMLGEIPLTVKFRTGIKQDKNIAHKFIPRFASEWGVSAMTVSISLYELLSASTLADPFASGNSFTDDPVNSDTPRTPTGATSGTA